MTSNHMSLHVSTALMIRMICPLPLPSFFHLVVHGRPLQEEEAYLRWVPCSTLYTLVQ
jgi:hypothetical protein